MMGSSSRFWDRIADRYARQPIADQAAYQRKLEITRDHLRADMELLEIGCGTGSTALLHAPHVKHIRATDISSRMIEIARAKAEAANVRNITFECSSIDDLRVDDESVGAVLGMSILHLVEDRDAVIARVHRMLEPGGVFITSTACLGDTMKFFKIIGPIGRLLGLMPTVKVFTASELETSLTEAGFAIEHRWQPGRGKALFLVARKPQTALAPGS
jgi:ubiquinone/menaquinone biosynthesis C-methylase UbiE